MKVWLNKWLSVAAVTTKIIERMNQWWKWTILPRIVILRFGRSWTLLSLILGTRFESLDLGWLVYLNAVKLKKAAGRKEKISISGLATQFSQKEDGCVNTPAKHL